MLFCHNGTTNHTAFNLSLTRQQQLCQPHFFSSTLSEQNVSAGYEEEKEMPPFQHILLFLLLMTFSVVTISGNCMVMLAVARERALHTATNYFITSLAVSDCVVGLFVMPFSAAYEAWDQKWIFGDDFCDVWHSFDVLGCTVRKFIRI